MQPAPRRIVAAVALALATAPFAAAAERLGRDVVPVAQDVDVTVDPARDEYSGAVRIELEVRAEAKAFAFHARDIELTRLELKGPAGAIALARHAGEEGRVEVTPERPLAAGRYTLAIDFHRPFGTRATGLYKVVRDGVAYAFTDFEPANARDAFPCFDEPAFKLPYRIRLTTPVANQAVANMPVESEKTARGQRVVRFRPTPPLPSYLVAFAAGPFDFVPIPGLGKLKGRVVTPRGQGALAALAVEMTPRLLARLEEYFGSPYPFAKLDLIAVPEFWAGAMENPGLITFTEAALLIDSRRATAAERRRLAVFITHELSHMWFGDLVTMTWWDDLWLNESFAEWLGNRVAGAAYPDLGIALTAVAGQQHVMNQDARPSAAAVRRPVTVADQALSEVGLAYDKGETVIGMFERWMGADAFRAGVRSYLAEHAWGNAVAADLWRALSRSSGSDVGRAMGTFLDQPGLPLVTVEVLPGARVALSQQRFAVSGVKLPPLVYQIPIVLKYSTGGAPRTKSLLLSGSATIELDGEGEIDWVMPNAAAAGYYRWAIEPERLRTLAARAGTILDPAERIAFAGNLRALLEAGAVSGDAYLELIAGLGRDPEPAVIEAMISGIEAVQAAFVPDGLEDAYASYLRRTLAPAVERFGIEKRAGEPETVSLLRPRLLELLGRNDAGRDPEVQSYAAAAAARYRQDPAAVDPAVAGAVLRIAAQGGDHALFAAYVQAFESARLPADRARYLGALGYFRDPAIAAEAAAYALKGPLRPNEIFTINEGLPDDARGRAAGWEWTVANFTAIAARVPPSFLAYLPFAAGGCEPERLEAARTFFAADGHHVDGTERSLAKVTDQVNDCVRLREREGKAAAAYLRRVATAGE